MLIIDVFTLFPAYFAESLSTSVLGRAQSDGHVQIRIIDIRTFATDKHHNADDRPFGGGPGMVMKVEPIHRALQAHKGAGASKPHIVLTSARGRVFTQEVAREYAALSHLQIVCGHYEGVDERVEGHLVDEAVRIGDYVLTGGEPAAAVMIDAVVRLLPGVLGNAESTQGESHDAPGIFGYPQYTRPEVYNGWKVPAVLLEGNHAEIAKWRASMRKKRD
jgi:tRNA (guanine37-N1)-methyltransferase